MSTIGTKRTTFMEENREFHGEEFFKFLVSWYNELREYRNKVSAQKGRPDEHTILILRMNKPIEDMLHRQIYFSKDQREKATKTKSSNLDK